MKNISIYCLCLNNELLTKVKHLNYIPVGLGDNNFSNEWLRDSTKINVSKKKSLLWRIFISLLVMEKSYS
jgi:hypothetical protein